MALAEKFLADYDSHLQTPLMATISRFIRENLTLSSGPAGRETDIAGQQKKVLRPLHPPAGHRDTPRFSRAVGEAHVKYSHCVYARTDKENCRSPAGKGSNQDRSQDSENAHLGFSGEQVYCRAALHLAANCPVPKTS